MSHPKSKFSEQEDASLKELVNIYGENNWEEVSAHLPGRNVRQVKERWMNYLSPALNNNPFTEDEDNLLLAKYDELGPKWVKMTCYFTGRTDIALKNRWMVIQRKIRLGLPLQELPPRRRNSPINDDIVNEIEESSEDISNEDVQTVDTLQNKVDEFYQVKSEDMEDFWGELFKTQEINFYDVSALTFL